MTPPLFPRRWAVPLALILIVILAVYKLVSDERQYIAVKTSLKQISTLQNLYHEENRFYATDLAALGFFPAHNGYTYSVVIATDAAFIAQAVRQKEGVHEVWQIDETGTIKRVAQE